MLALASDLAVAEESARSSGCLRSRDDASPGRAVFRIAHPLPRKVGLKQLLTGDPIQRGVRVPLAV